MSARATEMAHSATVASLWMRLKVCNAGAKNMYVLLAGLMANEKVAHELMLLLYSSAFSVATAVLVTLTA